MYIKTKDMCVVRRNLNLTLGYSIIPVLNIRVQILYNLKIKNYLTVNIIKLLSVN